MATTTIEKALKATNADPESLILHSDQGSQFTSLEFIMYCQNKGITQSISHAGCPYDNALKAELIDQYRFDTTEELGFAVSEFAYHWYNQVRPHSYNGYLTSFEKI